MTHWPCAVDTLAMTVRPKVIDTSANVTDSSAIVGQDLIIRFIISYIYIYIIIQNEQGQLISFFFLFIICMLYFNIYLLKDTL